MVKLTKIYTRGGDGGETSLGDGSRVAKHHARVDAYGEVDEANAALGLARLYVDAEVDALLSRIQNDLFDLGADLCVPETEADLGYTPLRIIDGQVDALEAAIDRYNADLDPLDSFVLPAGEPAAAHLHLARTVIRRAERRMTELSAQVPINSAAIKYANRLSDLLFVLARWANHAGSGDVKWVPGENR